MAEANRGRGLLWCVLTISLAFNVGFGGMFLARMFFGPQEPAPRERPPERRPPPLHERMDLSPQELEALRAGHEELVGQLQ